MVDKKYKFKAIEKKIKKVRLKKIHKQVSF